MNGKTAELKNVCQEIFKEMGQKNTELGEKSYGFHFTYSPEKSWRSDTKVLILTLNPQSWNVQERRHKTIIPSSPWPESNDYLDKKNISRSRTTSSPSWRNSGALGQTGNLKQVVRMRRCKRSWMRMWS